VARIPAGENPSEDSGLPQALLKKAGALLARREHSRGELRRKLLKLAGEPQVEAVLDRLEQLNLLNDGEYAYNFALYRMGRQVWGPAKVQEDLRSREVKDEIIDKALDRVRNELGDEAISLDYIRKFCRNHWPPRGKKHVQKLIMHLRGRGFSNRAILKALDRIPAPSVSQHFEMGE
jgi:regulatory protein